MGGGANPPLAAAATASAPAAAPANAAAVGNASGASGAVNISGAAAPPPAGPRVVISRPPLSAFLRIPLIRGEDDAVVCPDPGRPGTTKKIEVGKMMAVEQKTEEEKEGAAGGNAKTAGGADDKSSAIKPETSNDQTAEASEAKEKNKKEIPVPTITAVRGYDVDVPATYAVPASYVRNVCLHYDEAMDGNCEYNIDEEDEAWWRENDEFGPESKARVVMPGEEGDGTKVEGDAGTYAAGEAGGKGWARPEKARGKKGQFVKKTSSKDDANADAMDVDSAASDASLPPAAPSPPKKSYTVEQVLLLNPRYLRSRHSTRGLLRKYNPKLPLHLLERMLDVLEKATGFESIVTLPEAERVLSEKIPELVAIFGPLSERERRILAEDEERSLRRRLPLTLTNQLDGAGGFVDALDEVDATFPALAPPVTLPQVISQVYDHWVAKRSRLRKPLLRRYWPPTAPTDTNPHQVFRHRETEKRRLRKKRQNDSEAYRKMRRLKADFERVGGLCDLITRREGVGRALVELGNDYFEERLRGWIDTTGAPRQSGRLTRRTVEAALAVPRYYDDGPVAKQRGRGGMKRKRAAPYPPLPHHPAAGVSDPESRGPSPVPPLGVAPAPPPLPSGLPPPGAAPLLPPPKVVAGHDGGLPAPHFLQPLATRELPRTEGRLDGEGPSFPSYVNGRPIHPPGGPFRHRPRLGRGGRIMVDRVPIASPLPSASHRGSFADLPPKPTVVTYGTPMNKHGHDIAPLGADGPNYTLASSPGKFGPGRSPPARRDGRLAPLEGGTGTDAAGAPKAPPARSLAEVLPRSLDAAAGNPVARRIEEICARGLAEDGRASAEGAAASASGAPPLGQGTSPASPGAAWQDDGDEVLVPIEDWMEAPSGERLYGIERFAIGPL